MFGFDLMHHAMQDQGLPQPWLVRFIALQSCSAMGTRMSKIDWRSSEAYDRVQGAEITGLAWECLRRNPDFQSDHRNISKTIPNVSPDFRQRWGLCFRS